MMMFLKTKWKNMMMNQSYVKLNILRSFELVIASSSQVKSISNYLLSEAQFLTKRDQNEYEVNTVISLISRIDFLHRITKEILQMSKLFEPFINKDYLAKVFNGLDLCYYKDEYFGYLNLIRSFLNENQLDTYRNEVSLKKINDNRIYLSEEITPYYYHLVDNLDQNFKSQFEKKYNLFIKDLDGFNFDFVASSLSLIYNINSNKQEFLN